MKRAAEPVAGDGSICAVSITKRAKLEEPEAEAADGITRRSPKLEAADGAGISPEKPSKKEKGAEEKRKRSKKKRAEEKNKQPNKVEVAPDLSMEEKIMAKLAEFDKKMAEEKGKRSDQEKRIEEFDKKMAREKSKRSDQEKRMEEMLMRIEKIASKIEEQVADDGMKKEKMTKVKRAKKLEGVEVRENKVMREMADNEAGGLKKKKVVTWSLSQELLEYLRAKELMGLLASEASLPLWANKMTEELFPNPEDPNPEDPDLKDEIPLKERIAAEFQENREFDAHVLYQYRTEGYVEIEEEVSDEEVDEEVSDKEHDVEADGILVGKKPEKLSKKEKGAEEESKRSNQEKRTEEKNKVEFLTMEEEINAELAEEEKKNKRLLTVELSQALMEHYLFHEVLDYMVAKPMVTFGEYNFRQDLGMYDDPYKGAKFYAFRRRSIERKANVLQQYHTKGSAVLQFYATDDETE
ncbi:stress response protein NST1-like isoform X2 [Panicum hallii]|uniref:stress response protein NST1-like isoform X2 n=1 Tax=Panicum hallii TaxID=206008 RepID=UPI000DF4CAA6|nr:stress response protein NST1-like isoform X2 [Panicum hallii]